MYVTISFLLHLVILFFFIMHVNVNAFAHMIKGRKLTFDLLVVGSNVRQIIIYPFVLCSELAELSPCVWLSGILQALDTFNTAIVSPIYYAMFTSFTILASAIMFKVSSSHMVLRMICHVCGWERDLFIRDCYLKSVYIFLGLFWSKCKQHSIRTLWAHHCVIWDCYFAQYKRSRSTGHHRFV